MRYKKGIILAGGTGSRLYPMTKTVNKHLLPIYNKPIIYYPIATLMLAGITDILIICNKNNLAEFKQILGDGNDLNITISYAEQEKPNGIAESILIGETFIQEQPVALILGDNFFHGKHLVNQLKKIKPKKNNAHIFACPVQDPNRFGVVELNDKLSPISIVEKPTRPKSDLAVTGLYFYDSNVVDLAKTLQPSKRNELEITDLNKLYLKSSNLSCTVLDEEVTWLDVGTPEALAKATNYVQMFEHKQEAGIGYLEELAWRLGYISKNQFEKLVNQLPTSNYKDHLSALVTKKLDKSNWIKTITPRGNAA